MELYASFKQPSETVCCKLLEPFFLSMYLCNLEEALITLGKVEFQLGNGKTHGHTYIRTCRAAKNKTSLTPEAD